MKQRIYLCIDLKSFYASVECVERGLDPLKTNLVVADKARTEKTICLAVSPSLKAYGIPGRPRLFEVIQKVRLINAERKRKAPGYKLTGSSFDADELSMHPETALDYIVAPPQMAKYIKCSTDVYGIYLKYVSREDIHVYSIDEVFVDLTDYLEKTTARDYARMMIEDVLNTTGVTATAGIGTNLYLAKIAMDIVAKKMPADRQGVRIAELDETSYRRQLWEHRPITDFWRVGKGYAKKLEEHGMYTMGDVARCSLGKAADKKNGELLYKLFGINAELLIDHAWGWEPCTIKDIKEYKPASGSVGSGQVLHEPHDAERARLIVSEMADLLALDLVDRELVTDQLVLTIGYDAENLKDPAVCAAYKGEVTTDAYGRKIPAHSRGTLNLGRQTSSASLIIKGAGELYDRIVKRDLLIRRLNIVAGRTVPEKDIKSADTGEQLDLFTDYEALEEKRRKEETAFRHEKRVQKAVLSIKKKYGKNAILKAMNFKEGATARDRNEQIGGHRAEKREEPEK